MSENANLSRSDRFGNGFFWELYMDLERQFQSFLEYVPYLPENEKTYSFKLLNLILSIGGHVDSAFREMARYPKFSENEACMEILERASERRGIIMSGVEAFDAIYGLSALKVKFKCLGQRETVIPFSVSGGGENPLPEWWNFYNDLKHDVGFNIEQANLKNARNALAGAFILNVRHIPGALRLFEYGVLDTGYVELMETYGSYRRYRTFSRESLEKILENKEIEHPLSVETPVFSYKYNQKEE